MGIWTKRSVLIASAGAIALASPAPVASPAPTPAALLPRADYQTLGWYSDATIGDQTLYSPWEYDALTTTYSTSSTWFRRCAVSSTCTMYTGCSGGYLMAEGTSSYCGAGGASGSLFCSNHVLYTTMGDTLAYSWYWCDEPPLTGYTFYKQEPAQPTDLSTDTSTPATTDASTTTSDETSSTASTSGGSSSTSTTGTGSESQTASPQPKSSESKTNVGAIAGGVVGGLAGLALIGAGAFLLFRRRKSKTAATQPPAGYAPPPGQASPYQQPVYPASPNMGYAPTAYQANNEAKPQGVSEIGAFYNQQQPAAYPQGPYDPHTSQYGGSPPPQQATPNAHFAQPQHAPQELPTQPR